MGDHANGSLSSALRDIGAFSGTNPDRFDDWYELTRFTLSIDRSVFFHVFDGQAMPRA